MFKKIVSMLLLGCMVFTCIPLGVVFAQSDEDYIRSIPIVEFVPTCNGESHDYSKAKIISIDKDVALTTDATSLRSLISENRIVFFEKMTSNEVVQLTGIDGFHPTNELKDSFLIGTSLTYNNGVPSYAESFAVDVNNGGIEISSEEEAFCIQRTYANTKSFIANKSSGDLTSLASDQVFYHDIHMFENNKIIGYMLATSYLYSYGKLPVNGKRMYVYDVKTSFMLEPANNRCVKSLGLAIGCGYNSDIHRFIDVSTINTTGVTHTEEVTVEYAIGSGFSFGTTQGWSHDAYAFRCTTNFSDPTFAKWTINPIKPENNDTWQMQPGVRFVSEFSTTEVQIGFKGTLYSTSIFKPHPVCSFLRVFNNVKLKDK